MSTLSDADLLALHAATGQPVVPFLSELHRPANGGPSFGLSSAGYDVRLSDRWATYDPLATPAIEGSRAWRHDYLDPCDPVCLAALETELVTRYVADTYLLDPGKFVLACTMETFDMPDDLIGRVTDKSTWARLGVTVRHTIIENGWRGQLVLEIVNDCERPVLLRAGSGIAQVLFERLSTPSKVTYKDRGGKYQNQRGVTLPR